MNHAVLRVVLAALCLTACQRGAAPDPAIARLRALAAEPDEECARYALAARAAQAGDVAVALAGLEALDAAGWDYPLGDDDFAALAGSPRFRELQARVRARRPVAHASVAAFTVAARDLFPEGIAYDARADAFILGSMHQHRLVRVGRDGAVRELVSAGRDGLLSVLGVRVDDARGWVWAASNLGRDSAVHAFDLATGALRRRARLHGAQLLNDLAVDARGDVYVTDFKGGTVYRLAADGDRLQALLPAGALPGANGIAAAGRRIYVATEDGITWLDATATPPRPRRLAHGAGVRLGGIDGLVYEAAGAAAGAHLWALQTGLGEARVIVLTLDAGGTRVVAAATLESANGRFRFPTTGALAPDGYYYLASTSLDVVDDYGVIVRRPESAQPPQILRIPREAATR